MPIVPDFDAAVHAAGFLDVDVPPLEALGFALRICACGRGIWHRDRDGRCSKLGLFTAMPHTCPAPDPWRHLLELARDDRARQAAEDGWRRAYGAEA